MSHLIWDRIASHPIYSSKALILFLSIFFFPEEPFLSYTIFSPLPICYATVFTNTVVTYARPISQALSSTTGLREPFLTPHAPRRHSDLGLRWTFDICCSKSSYLLVFQSGLALCVSKLACQHLARNLFRLHWIYRSVWRELISL